MDNKRSVHKHFCLSPKNGHGSGHAVNLLHFPLLLNLTTAAFLQGSSAWLSVGADNRACGVNYTKAFSYDFVTWLLWMTHWG